MSPVLMLSLAVAVLIAAPGCAQTRPRIFITPDDLPRLWAMTADTRENSLGYVPAEVWQELKARADRFVAAPPYQYGVNMPGREGGPSRRWEYTLSAEPPPRHDDFPHYPPWTAMFQERADSITTRLQLFCLAYVVTQEQQYFEKAREIVLNMAAWPIIWTDPSYGGGRPCLDTGHAATWVGIFYDWCHDAMTAQERATVREALAEKALAPIADMIDGVAPYHNYTAVIANGLAIGALALVGEDERAEGWIEHALRRMTMHLDVQGRDGGPMEGPMYGTYATDQVADTIWALTTAGVQNTLVGHEWLGTLPLYCISLSNPNDFAMPCFGDGGPGRGPMGRLMLTLALRGDTDAAWYCREAGLLNPSSVRSFLILDPDRIRPQAPEFNPSAAFVDVGYAILRDGFNPGTVFLAFKAGPPEAVIGHNHYDHNSFVINYDGAWVAWDPGYRSYFNPPARRYTTSTLGHNSLVVDFSPEYLEAPGHPGRMPGHDQVHLNRGRIAEFFTSEGFDYVLGRGAETYNTADLHVLDRFDRQIVLAKPNVVFIRDTLAAPEEHTYTTLLHLDGAGEFETDGDMARGISSRALLQAHTFSPHGIQLAAATYPGAENYGPYLAATTGRARQTTITTVLVPRRHGELLLNPGFEKGMAGWTPRRMPGFAENHVIDTEVKRSGEASARIDNGGYYYSNRFVLPPGTRLTARFWARATAPTGASSLLYYWRDGVAFRNTRGPAADADEWRQYEFSDVIPEGTQEVSLALQFFGEGQCWYDDVEVGADVDVPASEPATVTPLGDGAEGAVVLVDGVAHVLLCGEAGQVREQAAGGHVFRTDAELAVVTLLEAGPRAFLLRGSLLELDGRRVEPAPGEWRVREH